MVPSGGHRASFLVPGDRTLSRSRPSATATVRFPPHTALRAELKRRVDEYFNESNRSTRGGPRLLIKAVAIGLWAAASWVYLVFAADGPIGVSVAGASLGLAVAGIGFNVMHDGGHGTFSRWAPLNRLTAWIGDLVGGSSYLWNHKHNILHHTATNVSGVDDDLDAGPFLRLSPLQRRRWFHRFQHLYVWPLYGLLLPKWQVWDDLGGWLRGRIGTHRVPRPRGRALVAFLAGKLAFFGWALAVPLWFRPAWAVFATYAWVCLVAGLVLGVVFQLAHCVCEADFPDPPPDGRRLGRTWTEHQLATTTNFCPRNRLLAWYLGGLNYQVEHHLFPRISHVHYPGLAPIVRAVCLEFGVPYLSHDRLSSAVASHVRLLRRLGRPGAAVVGV